MTDLEIIEQIKEGDLSAGEKALRYMYRSYYRLTEQVVLANSGTKEDAKDIFQETIMVFYNRVKKNEYKLDSKISTFLYSVSRNMWFCKLRGTKKERNEVIVEEMQEPADIDTIADLIYTENQVILADLLSQSGETCSKLLKLFYFDKMKMLKIAELFGYGSEQVAKNQKSRCIKKLKAILMKNETYKENLINSY